MFVFGIINEIDFLKKVRKNQNLNNRIEKCKKLDRVSRKEYQRRKQELFNIMETWEKPKQQENVSQNTAKPIYVLFDLRQRKTS